MTWTEKKTSLDVLEWQHTRRCLRKPLGTGNYYFLGHVCKTQELEHLVLTSEMEGERDRLAGSLYVSVQASQRLRETEEYKH